MDSNQAAYDESGNLVCRTCASSSAVAVSNATIEAKDPGSVRNLWGAAATSVLLGMGTCCTSGMGRYFFVLSAIPMFVGIGTVVQVLRDSSAKERLGEGGFYGVIALSIFGAVFGMIGTGIGLLGMVAQGWFAAQGY